MLKEIHRLDARFSPSFVREDADLPLVVPRASSIQRHKKLILLMTALFVLPALIFALVRHDSFTAVTRLLIDNKSLHLSSQDAVFARSEVDVPLIQNQIELLKSATIANQVIEIFKLWDDPNFTSRRGFLTRLLAGQPAHEDNRGLALQSFERRLYVGRVGDSYTLEIRFTASDADKAASIANAIGADYIAFVADQNAKVAQSASPWLRSRLKDMGPNASVITAASPPLYKDGPSSLAILFAAILAGLTFGVTGAFAVDARDRSVRTPHQASAAAGAESFGVAEWSRNPRNNIDSTSAPGSFISHAIRRAIAAIRDEPGTKIVGVISTLPGEGKTFVARNFVHLAAASGMRVLLIDAAMGSGTLSAQFASNAEAGLTEVLSGQVQWSDVLLGAANSNLRFLPLAGRHPPKQRQPARSLDLSEILAEAATIFDLVVVDLPPATFLADVREVASAVDGFIMVIEWGKTPVDVVEHTLAGNNHVRRKLLGVILNKVNVGTLKTYDRSFATFQDRANQSSYLRGARALWNRARAIPKPNGKAGKAS
jgi:capsular exopolysaccharide synthesis family protein